MSEPDAQCQVSLSILARKFRKKLRQIENLERLNRPLTEEECVKVNLKSSIRDQLKDVLERIEEEAEKVTTEPHDNRMPEEQQGQGESFVTPKPTGGPEKESLTIEATNIDSDVSSVSQLPTTSSTVSKSVDSVNSNTTSKTTSKVLQKEDTKAQSKVASVVNPTKERKEGKVGKGSAQLSKRLCRVAYLKGHNDIITSLVIVDGKVVTASRDTALKSWDLSTGDELQTFGGHTETVTCVIAVGATFGCVLDQGFSSDDSLIISSSFDCSFKMWSLNTGRLLKSVYTFNPLTKICFFSSRNQLVTGSDGGKLELWNIATGENSFSTLAFDASVTDIAVSDQTIFSSSSDGIIKVHQLREDGSLACLFVSDEIKTIEGRPLTPRHVRCMAKIPEGIIYGDDSRNIKLLDWKKGHVRKFLNHTSDFSSTDAVACRESYILTSSYNLDDGLGYINVRHGGSLTYQATLDDGETERIMCLDFCLKPGGDILIVSGGIDLKIWQILSAGASPNSSNDEQVIKLEFRQSLSVSATDSDSESEEDSSDDALEEEENDGRGRAAHKDDDSSVQAGGLWSWCSIL